jgi:hypothetical protein
VVEADDEDSVEGTRRFEQCSHSVDGEVRPLGLLDLDKDPHLLALRPIHGLREGRNACSCKSSVEAGPGIKAADLFQTEVGGEAVAICGAVERPVVKHDRFAIGSQHDVNLDCCRTRSLGGGHGRHRVFRADEAVASVSAHMDSPGIAGEKTKGHRR